MLHPRSLAGTASTGVGGFLGAAAPDAKPGVLEWPVPTPVRSHVEPPPLTSKAAAGEFDDNALAVTGLEKSFF